MSETQPGQQTSAPDSGQLADTSRPEPPIELPELTDAEYNADGTFEYPPVPRSARQLLEFWTRVPVADSILHRVETSYMTKRREERLALRAQAEEATKTSEVAKRQMAEAKVDAQGYVERVMVNDNVRSPSAMRTVDVRTLVRAERAWRQAGSLPESEREAVLSFKVHVEQQGGMMTLREAHEKYRLDQYDEAMSDPMRWTPSAIHELYDLIDERIPLQGFRN